MRRTTFGLALSLLLVGSAAVAPLTWAQDSSRSNRDTMGTTQASSEAVSRGYLGDTIFEAKPSAGIVAFTDQTGDYTSRLAAGLQLDMNAMPLFFKNSNDMILSHLYVGPQTGLIYSHLGAPTSNFVGTNESNNSFPNAQGANLLVIPTDLKIGYTLPGDFLRVGAHGGANVVYRSVANSINLGNAGNGSDDKWSYYPNVGADVELMVTKNVAISARPDWTVTRGNDFFTGTLGVGIALG